MSPRTAGSLLSTCSVRGRKPWDTTLSYVRSRLPAHSSRFVHRDYKKPEDLQREKVTREKIAAYGGEITYRETDLPESVCWTVEFPDWDRAEKATNELRNSGEHVEGPSEY